MTLPRLDTARLSLTELREADAPAMFRYRAHPDVHRYQGFAPSSLSEVKQFIANARDTPLDAPGTWYQLAIREPAADEIIGDIGIHTLSDGNQVELGVTLAPAHQRRGFAREALVAVLDDLLITRSKHRATASVDPRNASCCRLLQGLGFRREALHRQSYWFRSCWVDDAVYAMLRCDWLHDGGHTRNQRNR